MLALAVAMGLIGGFQPTGGVSLSCTEGAAGPEGRARVEVVVAAGVLHEDENARGVAHLLEHLVFRPLGFDDSNGETSWDYTSYYRDVSAKTLDDAAHALLSAMAEVEVTDTTLEVERKVVLRELTDRGVSRVESSYDPWFEGTRLARSPGGSASSVEGLTADDVTRFHRRFYRRGNMAVVIRGALDCTTTRDRLADVLASFPEGEVAPLPRVEDTEPGARRYEVGADTFLQGFYWYDASLEEELVYRLLSKHLEQESLRVLRKERGLTYSPKGLFERRGRGGRIWLTVLTDEAGTVESWYDETIADLGHSDRPLAAMKAAVAPVRKALGAEGARSALAHLHSEPDPVAQLDELSDGEVRDMLITLLNERRAFGGRTPSNWVSIVVLLVFTVGVLAAMGLALKSFLADR